MDNSQLYKTVQIESGSHYPGQGKACVMEVVSMLSNEPFSDTPDCACSIITNFAIRTNDWMLDSERNLLWPFTTRIAGSRADLATEKERLCLVTNWACRRVAPAILEAEGCFREADACRELEPIKDSKTAVAAEELLTDISSDIPRIIDLSILSAAKAAALTAKAFNSYDDFLINNSKKQITSVSLAIASAAESCTYVTYNFNREQLLDLRLELLDELCPDAPLPDEFLVCQVKEKLETVDKSLSIVN